MYVHKNEQTLPDGNSMARAMNIMMAMIGQSSWVRFPPYINYRVMNTIRWLRVRCARTLLLQLTPAAHGHSRN